MPRLRVEELSAEWVRELGVGVKAESVLCLLLLLIDNSSTRIVFGLYTH